MCVEADTRSPAACEAYLRFEWNYDRPCVIRRLFTECDPLRDNVFYLARAAPRITRGTTRDRHKAVCCSTPPPAYSPETLVVDYRDNLSLKLPPGQPEPLPSRGRPLPPERVGAFDRRSDRGAAWMAKSHMPIALTASQPRCARCAPPL